MKLSRLRRSLSMQMAVNFALLILLTAVVVGLPAVWLLRGQIERQAWALLAQGASASQALYEAGQSEVGGLAVLTAQRPRLHELVIVGDQEQLFDYLVTLQQGVGLDALQICAPDGQQYAIVGLPIASDICAAPTESHFYLERGPAGTAAWFLAAHPLTDAADGYGRVIVGTRLDDAYLARIRNQSGMAQILLFDGEILAFSGGAAREEWAAQLSGAAAPRAAYQFDDRAYYAAAIPWPEEAYCLLPTADCLLLTDYDRPGCR